MKSLFSKSNNKFKAFTLIELLAVILILSIIALIVTAVSNTVVTKSKEKAYNQIVDNIKKSAYNYSVYKELGYNKLYKKITLTTLKSSGYLENKTIIDPRTDEEMNGCVLYRWEEEKKQYEFLYSEDCDLEVVYPDLIINVLNGQSITFATEKLRFEILGDYDNYKYCVGNNCEPNRSYSGTTTVNEEGAGIYICASGYIDNEKGKTTCAGPYKVDTTAPEVTLYSSGMKTDRITINASCVDDESDIVKYEFSSDNGETWIDNGTTTSYDFLNLVADDTYDFNVKCTNGAGFENEDHKSIQIPYIVKPIISQNSQYIEGREWAQNRVIKIEYSDENIETPEYYFKSTVEATVGANIIVASCGNSTLPGDCTSSSITSLTEGTWYKTESTMPLITYTQNGYLYAMTKDSSNNKSETATYNITNIDTTVPVINSFNVNSNKESMTVVATCSDAQSGITKYEFKLNNENWVDKGTTTTHTFTNLLPETDYDLEVRCTNGSGLTAQDEITQSTLSISKPVITQISKNPPTPIYALKRTIRIRYDSIGTSNIENYFKNTGNVKIEFPESPSSGNLLMQCGNSTLPGTCTAFSSEQLSVGTWYKVVGENIIDLSYEESSYLTALTKIPNKNLTATLNVDIYDSKMTINPTTTGITKNRVIVLANCEDEDYDITNIKYSSDNGVTWIDAGTQTSYSFNNLNPGTTYNFSVKCKNEVGYVVRGDVRATTLQITPPIIRKVAQTPSNTTYAQTVQLQVEYILDGVSFTNNNAAMFIKTDVDATIIDDEQEAYTTYDEVCAESGTGCTWEPIQDYRNREFLVAECGSSNSPGTCTEISENEYISANTWYKVSNDVDETINLLFNNNGHVYAITQDDYEDQSLMSTYAVNNIDNQKPVITTSGNSYDVTVTITDNIGLSSYKINSDTSVAASGKSVSIPISANENNYVYAYDLAGNEAYYEFEVSPLKWEFPYRGYVESFTAPYTGTYKLEVWGSEGTAPVYRYSVGTPGKGGYSRGNVSLTAGDTLYVVVGGNTPYEEEREVLLPYHTYNGGGVGQRGSGSGEKSGNGGGATHIATSNYGELYRYVTHRADVLIVAGGGGGAGYDPPHGTDACAGGSGGGITGVGGTSSYGNKGTEHRAGTGGTQSDAGENGRGGDSGGFGYGGWRTGTWAAGGGGGWYGGGAGYNRLISSSDETNNDLNDSEGAGGGSGYIGNSRLTDKVMYCYECVESSDSSTKTISTTNASESPISNYAKIGTGFARITYISN